MRCKVFVEAGGVENAPELVTNGADRVVQTVGAKAIQCV